MVRKFVNSWKNIKIQSFCCQLNRLQNWIMIWDAACSIKFNVLIGIQCASQRNSLRISDKCLKNNTQETSQLCLFQLLYPFFEMKSDMKSTIFGIIYQNYWKKVSTFQNGTGHKVTIKWEMSDNKTIKLISSSLKTNKQTNKKTTGNRKRRRNCCMILRIAQRTYRKQIHVTWQYRQSRGTRKPNKWKQTAEKSGET